MLGLLVPGTKHTALLDLVTLGIGGTRDSDHDAGGYLDLVDLGANDIDFTFDDAGSLAAIARPVASESLTLLYDGRGFLREAADAITGGWVKPFYSSEGRLMSLERLPIAAGTSERIHVLYFAGRPVAIWKKVGAAAATWNPIVTDHLGTPVYALTTAGAQHWLGGFEPFGRDHQQGGAQDSLAKGIFLRMPGQWDDPLFNGATLGDDVYYNVHRWYEVQTARYVRVDPLNFLTSEPLFAYASASPLRLTDPLGLYAQRNFLGQPACKGRWSPYSTFYGVNPPPGLDPAKPAIPNPDSRPPIKRQATRPPGPNPGGKVPRGLPAPMTCFCSWICIPCEGAMLDDPQQLPVTRGAAVNAGGDPTSVNGCICPAPSTPEPCCTEIDDWLNRQGPSVDGIAQPND